MTGSGGGVPPAAEKAVRKYLAHHAEPEAARAREGSGSGRRFGHVLCVPAYGEGEGLLETLATIPRGPLGEVLTVVVVNESGASPDWVRAANRASLAALRARAAGRSSAGGGMTRQRHALGDLWVIDRTHTGRVLPEGQGVGLARKIGADVALALWAEGAIDSPWIHCSDADVVFPADYFARPVEAAGGVSTPPAAWVYDFRHRPEPDPETARAALRYEIFLRYYVLGLRSAGSRYAFHTIGSTLALSPLAYARARGFPRRQAAEDFHLLAKLAKLGRIEALRGEPIVLSGRVSTRVPFGTGAGIAKELARAQAGAFYPAYDPRVFSWLGVWLRTLSALGGDAVGRRPRLRDELSAQAETAAGVDATLLYDLLDECGAIRAAEAGRAQSARQRHERFDALRTLQLCHHLRDRRFPSIPLETAIRRAPFLNLKLADAAAGQADLAALCEALARCETERPDLTSAASDARAGSREERRAPSPTPANPQGSDGNSR